jgi:hypothetical protein
MANAIQRSEILDYQTYTEKRDAIQADVLVAKKDRRIHVGDNLTFLFENKATLIYQIQEMMRVERIVKEADILHEIETYGELLGGPGELGCTLLIEIADPETRDVLLRKWLGLTEHLYARLADGRLVRPEFDARQVGEDRLSSVQYLKFNFGHDVPVALGADHPELTVEAELSEGQIKALTEDLAATR